MSINKEEETLLRILMKTLDSTKPFEQFTQTDSLKSEVEPGSELADDDAKTDPYHVSHSAWHALTVAMDHIQCLRSSLLSDSSESHASLLLHTHAQCSLLRGALENSARAVWMLNPDSPLIRVQRRLSLQAGDVRHAHHLEELVKATPRRTREVRMNQLIQLVTVAGTSPADAARALKAPGYGEIVRDAGMNSKIGGDFAEMIWSVCSGLSHGDAYATLSVLDREVMRSADGVQMMRFTSSVKFLARATTIAVAMIQRGFELFEERSSYPSRAAH